MPKADGIAILFRWFWRSVAGEYAMNSGRENGVFYFFRWPNKNTRLSSTDIGKAIGRARRTVDSYIADLRAATQLGMDLKIFRMNRLGIPQDRIAKRLGQSRETIRDHLAKMATLPNPPNSHLSRGFTVSQVAEKHNWTEPMVWSLALEDKEDIERFKELGWGEQF